jgi:hypothetical protein
LLDEYREPVLMVALPPLREVCRSLGKGESF